MFEAILDFIFPKRCVGCKKIGSYLCAVCLSKIELFTDFVCPMCLRRSITGETHPSCITPLGLDGMSSGVVYKGVVKRLVFSLKFKPYVSDLKLTCGRLFYESISQNELFSRVLLQQPIVVPIPLSSEKQRSRGYNQADLLGEYLATIYKLIQERDILKRNKKTIPQFKLNKKQRFKNVESAFLIDPEYKHNIKGKTIILLDDLATSCATLRECAKVLKRHGAKKVYGVTFAREL